MEKGSSEGRVLSRQLNGLRKLGALKGMQLLAAVVFLGWLMIWIVKPTNKYQNEWSPKIQADTKSTYLGRQGTNILIYTFPVLFISVLGCGYIHLLKKSTSDDSQWSARRLAWKRPVLVNWPLGVVSGIELAFCLMFLGALVWSFSVYLVVGFSNMNSSHMEHGAHMEAMWKRKLSSAAIRLGLVGDFSAAFLLFPVTRGSSILPLVGLTSESSVKYHVWLGHITMAFFTAHGVCYIVYWACTNQMSEAVEWVNAGISNVAGEISLLGGLVLWATTFPQIRRKNFELFYYTHHFYIVFFFFYILHVGISHFSYVLGGVFLFIIDRYLRFLQSRTKARLVSARLLPSEGIELNFAKTPGLAFEPLSTLFINVPSVSSLQWHPFTVTSSSNLEPERLSVVIKREGDWTQKLYTTLTSPNVRDQLQVSVEGPYGPVSKNFLRYESLVLVSGGSGITPFISIIREFIYQRTILKKQTPAVLLICAFKTYADLTMLDLLLPISGDVSELSRLNLRIEAFVTRERPPSDEAQKKSIQTIWFKLPPSCIPIAPVIGPNGWICLAAIISSSFVAYLILISIIQGYYIYPIDHNTNAIYSSSAKATLNVLVICICILVAASAVFLWHKRANLKEAKQIKNVDAPTPTATPSSFLYSTDTELESVPQGSLLMATNVHYSGRPLLKKMLLEVDGSNVGVMASGPRGMRHEVATICSSGIADNLHFESISFNW